MRTIDQLTAVVLVQDHEEGVCIVKSSVSRTESGKGSAKQWAKRMCARVQAEKMLYDARENSGASGEAYTLPDMSVRLDRIVPKGRRVEVTSSEKVVLMCPSVDAKQLKRAEFAVVAKSFASTVEPKCNDATMVGLAK